ncbi:hypothetical protein LSUB1_G003607 [Lachnellula subtilissima]|uniref:Uncharacterized protein n=1 Tax=Lachnellula subtilissima TaxID=602034 RepID=A0A8H8UEY0_9HELO|nr:hypothetical protein LSUB1_G003607 [Lachnellula subtilissima]
MSKFRSPGTRANNGGSIRGRIGPPIPIPDDDEFPIRTPGTGIATPVGTGSVERSLGRRGSNATDHSSQQTGNAASGFTDRPRSASIPAQPVAEEPPRRTTQPNALRNSTASIPSGTSVGKPQRKKSSLRSVLGKLFGKKRKGGSNSTNENGRSTSGVRDQHRSDPTALNRNTKGTPSPQKRSASLPVNEYNRALRSHSTALEEFDENSALEHNRESIQADGRTRPRRATTLSRLWTPNRTLGHADWTGLSPRPASSHVRGSRIITDAEAEEAIGMAITSGSHPKRRSRSLGELRKASALPTKARRRSDEIRYWRESYDPGVLSPMSSNKAEPEEPIILADESEYILEPEEQPQPFNFGPMGEMAGMKITQAASLDTRVQRLEERMQKVERIILRSRGAHPDALQLQDPPKRNPNRIQSKSFTRPGTDNSENSLPKHDRPRDTYQPLQESQNIRNRSPVYSRPSTVDTNSSYQHSLEPFLALPSPNGALDPTDRSARPLSTSTTIRGIPSSSPTIAKDGSLTIEHYTALTNMIAAEQAARQQLELIVRSLQQQLQALRTSTPGPYHTPESNHVIDPLIDIPGGEFSSFEQDDDTSDDEEGYGTEAFQTPQEERTSYRDDTFGDVMNEGEKNSPRTMSLSQMTLNKGLHCM